jgi:hypothetical protein
VRRIPKGVAYHEAGHAVAALVVCMEVNYVEARPDGSGVTGFGDAFCDDQRLWHRRLLIVTLAGPYAQARVSRISYGTAMLKADITGDEYKAQESADWLASHGFAGDDTAARRSAAVYTKFIVRSRWPAITRVAEALRLNGQLEADEVVRLCQ